MMAMMIIIILIFKGCLLVLLCMSWHYDPLQEESHRAGFEALKQWNGSSPSSLPTPASPCHALLEEAAKWASDVAPGGVGKLGGTGAAVVVASTDNLAMCDLVFCFFLHLFALCFSLKEPPVPHLPDPWCLTPLSPVRQPLRPSPRPHWTPLETVVHVLEGTVQTEESKRTFAPTAFPLDCNVDLIFIFCVERLMKLRRVA